jgi:CDGSH-type Zn-finger protein
MRESDERAANGEKCIVVEKNGPYVVRGHVPLVCKTQIVSEYGEPLTWRKDDVIEAGETYRLCRCGRSRTLPFCDDTHLALPFDGTETAACNTTAERRFAHKGGAHIVVRRDNSLCAESGFCGNRLTDIRKMTAQSADPQIRAQIMAMAERCPSGSYTYALAEGQADIEPDLPQQIAVTTEITSDGPIAGPLWVTGGIPIVRSDGQPFETRNRVTLCCCGRSKSKPLCDGSHRSPGLIDK